MFLSNRLSLSFSTNRKTRMPHLHVLTVVLLSTSLNVTAADEVSLVAAMADDFCDPNVPVVIQAPECPPISGSVVPVPTPMPQPNQALPLNSTEPPPGSGTTNSADPDGVLEGSQSFDPPINENSPQRTPTTGTRRTSSGAAASSLASNTGSRGGLDAPNMLGDFLGQRIIILPGNLSPGTPGSAITAPTIANQRFKISENVSPIPRDQFFFNFNTYTDSLVDGSGVNQTLYRYQVGAESTILDELFSFEFRMSIADGFDSSQNADFGVEQGAEFGNLQLAVKTLLYSDCKTQVGTGLTLALPTADDLLIEDTGLIANESVFIGPFIGFVVRPNRECFIQGFLQTDLTLGGDTILNADGTTAGVFQQQNFIYTSLSAGRWLYYDTSSEALINGLAGMVELHYSATTNDADLVTFDGPGSSFSSQIGTAESFADAPNLRSDFLNVIAGMVIQRNNSFYRFGVGSSVRGDDDRLFDMEYQVQYNRAF